MRRTKALIFFVLIICLSTLFVSCHQTSEETKSNESDTEEISLADSPNMQDSNVILEITPIEELGITGTAQDVNITEYRLIVNGLVEEPLSLSYEDILSYPSITEVVVLVCPDVFVDVAEWTGVPLMTILAEAGIRPEASQVFFHAIDGYSRRLSLEHINTSGVFLAYGVNGQKLPPEHGFPLRVVDKDSDGSFWVKWLQQIEIE